MTERIDHVAETLSFLGGAVIDTYGDDDRKVAIAQVHATLALVEQQRIANLIALGLIGNFDGQVASEHDGDLALDARRGLGIA